MCSRPGPDASGTVLESHQSASGDGEISSFPAHSCFSRADENAALNENGADRRNEGVWKSRLCSVNASADVVSE